MTHKIKIQKEYADAIVDGEKTFEIRYNDRGYQKGDRIVFKEVTSESDYCAYTHPNHEILKKEYEITYVISGWGLKEDWVALAIKEVKGDKV